MYDAANHYVYKPQNKSDILRCAILCLLSNKEEGVTLAYKYLPKYELRNPDVSSQYDKLKNQAEKSSLMNGKK